MTPKHVYLALAAAGLAVPYYFFVSFLAVHGPDGRAFLSQLFGTPISSFFATDLLVACAVFVVFLRREGARTGVRNRWLYLLALATVGLSFALPLYLYAREARLEDPTTP